MCSFVYLPIWALLWILSVHAVSNEALARCVNPHEAYLTIAVIGLHKGFHFSHHQPERSKNEFELKVDNLAFKLHSLCNKRPQTNFVILLPNHQHTHRGATTPKTSLPFQSKILYVDAATKSTEGFYKSAISTIRGLHQAPDVLWVFENIAVEKLAALKIPMLLSWSMVPHHNHISTYSDNVLHRFYSSDSHSKWDAHLSVGSKNIDEANPQLIQWSKISKEFIVVSDGPDEASDLLVKSANLLCHNSTQQAHSGTDSTGSDKPKIATSVGDKIGTVVQVAPLKPVELQKTLVVGSMTTVLKRLEQIEGPFGKTLDSILNIEQIDILFLNIPWSYGVRTVSQNITLPKPLLDKVESVKNGRLRILRSKDYGPATKLLPTLLLGDDILPPDTMVITFDDDRLYTKEAVAALVSTAEAKKDHVVAIAAWPVTILSSNGRRGRPGGPNFKTPIPRNTEGIQYTKAGPVDLSLGFYGVLYRKSFFTKPALSRELFDYDRDSSFTKHCMWVDDIWFSGHLERLKIPRWCIGKVPNSRADITPLSNVGALSLDLGESVKQNFDNVNCAEGMSKIFNIWKS